MADPSIPSLGLSRCSHQTFTPNLPATQTQIQHSFSAPVHVCWSVFLRRAPSSLTFKWKGEGRQWSREGDVGGEGRVYRRLPWICSINPALLLSEPPSTLWKAVVGACAPIVAIFVKSKPPPSTPSNPSPSNPTRHRCRARGQRGSGVGHFDLTCSWKNRKSSCWRFSTWPSHWLIAGFSAQDAASFVCVKTAVCTLYLGAFGELYLTSFVSASQSLPRPSPHGSPGPHGLDGAAGAGGRGHSTGAAPLSPPWHCRRAALVNSGWINFGFKKQHLLKWMYW